MANTSGSGYATFSFQVQDDGGTANGGVDTDPTARTITIDVTSVNDAPQGMNQTVSTLEDVAYVLTTADFGFSDPSDAPRNSLLGALGHYLAASDPAHFQPIKGSPSSCLASWPDFFSASSAGTQIAKAPARAAIQISRFIQLSLPAKWRRSARRWF